MKRKIFLIAMACAVLTLSGCKSSDYKKASELMNSGSYEEAIPIFEELGDYKDSADMINVCKYGQAAALYDGKQFDNAKIIFEELGDYQDSADRVTACKYGKAAALYDDKQFDSAQAVFEELGDYKDSADKVKECKYGAAVSLYDSGDFKTAYAKFKLLEDYEDSEKYAENAMWEILYEYYPYVEDVNDSIVHSETIQDYSVEFSIRSTQERDGLEIKIILTSSNTVQTTGMNIYAKKDNAIAAAICIMTFGSNDVTMLGNTSFKPSKYNKNDNFEWEISGNYSSKNNNTSLVKNVFDSSFASIMDYLEKEFDNNGLGFTLADIGFTNY